MGTSSSPRSSITPELRRQFQTEGYFVLPAIVPPAQVAMMRETCATFIKNYDAEMDAAGVTQQGINIKGSRYFIANRHRGSRLGEFIFSDLMAEICRATLGDSAYLFWEQFVVKGPEKGAKFSWHQDSGYVGTPHRPYITCWVTLDDVTEANGTVYILPYSRAGSRDLQPHVKNAETNDLEGYFGADPGDPVIVPAGSIAVFSSHVFHRSGFNTTPHWRRVYLPQYSAEPIRRADGSLVAFAEPFLEDGKRVAAAGPGDADTRAS
ncbi:phytanoyl-CoA dioxygenase family protein [Horticoccus luteus]|uniref:Phytanoyl-CoA dioxygenase family protein n=1 Tax=Horticoccus luteus TaxID=2862869 RepID=A0A8F9XH82_9BACT|nr:phytanoyl-CoA dioxygenase family protein [Horticoccus luteus]QYM79045.1 phytanoyl-CoA dioxygenase family protein [Horticoccus luteus]